MFKIVQLLVAFTCGFLLLSGSGRASPQEIYKGRTVRVVTFGSPGGSYDVHARHLVRHLGRHIPGAPKFIVQNMPGGGGKIAANYVYNVKSTDPFTILGPHPDAHTAQLVGEPGVEYDVSRFQWIGSIDTAARILIMRADRPYADIQRLRRGTPKEISLAVTGPGSGSYAFARLYEHVLGIEFRKLIYARGSELYLAVERGEADGVPATLETFRITHFDWLKKGFAKIVLQGGEQRHKSLVDVPTLYELVSSQFHEIIRLMGGSEEWSKPFALAPRVPREYVQVLREAFMETMRDPSYVQEAQRLSLTIEPLSGTELQVKMQNIVKQSPQTIELLKKLLKD